MRDLINIMEQTYYGYRLHEDLHGGDAVIDAAVKLFLRAADGEDIDNFRYDLSDYINGDPDDDEDREAKMHAALPEFAKDRCQYTSYELRRLVQSGKVAVWRVITAPRSWTPGKQPLGTYWSWDEDAAEAHWGSFSKDQVEWLLHGEIAADDIDWPSTIAANAFPSYEDEKEITLRAGRKVHLLWYQILDKPDSRVEVNQIMETDKEPDGDDQEDLCGRCQHGR